MKTIVVIAAGIGAYIIGNAVCKEILNQTSNSPTRETEAIESVSALGGILISAFVMQSAADLLSKAIE